MCVIDDRIMWKLVRLPLYSRHAAVPIHWLSSPSRQWFRSQRRLPSRRLRFMRAGPTSPPEVGPFSYVVDVVDVFCVAKLLGEDQGKMPGLFLSVKALNLLGFSCHPTRWVKITIGHWTCEITTANHRSLGRRAVLTVPYINLVFSLEGCFIASCQFLSSPLTSK